MPIDLVITDIRMPFMDGLEMAKEIRKIQPMVSFIILSGFDDFEYTRQAILIKISDYVLKPVSSDELIPILRGVKASMDERFAQHRDIRLLQERFQRKPAHSAGHLADLADKRQDRRCGSAAQRRAVRSGSHRRRVRRRDHAHMR